MLAENKHEDYPPSSTLKLYRVISPTENSEEPIYLDDTLIDEDYLLIFVDQPLNQAYLINLDTVGKAPIRVTYSELLISIDEEMGVIKANGAYIKIIYKLILIFKTFGVVAHVDGKILAGHGG